MKISPLVLQTPGTFTLGCNYWASHAGTAMWSNWQPEVVRRDLAKLAAHGLQTLRVFPLWPDFQPITQLRTYAGIPYEIRLGENPLPPDAVGQAGLSREMLGRFAEFCALAEDSGLTLIVGLITGWMSGRLFVPPALEGRDPITDPVSLAWQIRFVRGFVTELLSQKAIVAWDLGNECNCMGVAPTRDAAFLWTASLSQAIRVADNTRPIVSGMHSLATPVTGVTTSWTIDDQGYLTDILTTHPYPYWTRHTRADPVNALRTTLHATAETRFYADVSGKPCFAEELGTMGPMVAGDDASADFARVNLFSLWANDCRGFQWWCAHDQTELTHAPYDWIGVEVELGLLRNDGSAKPVLLEMAAFRKFLDGLPFAALPVRRVDAVCILTHNQDDWAAAFGSFVLAKQAKLEIEFRHIQQGLPESGIYLLPSLKGPHCIPRRQWLELLQRVRAGATLYLSLGDGIVANFNEVAGVELVTRAQVSRPLEAELRDGSGARLPLGGGDDLVFQARGAEVLATRVDNGAPAWWRHRYGKGSVLVYTAPVEMHVTLTPGAFAAEAPPYWKIYAEIARAISSARRFNIDCPQVAVTEHELADGSIVIVAINHGESSQTLKPAGSAGAGFSLGTVWRGDVTCDPTQALRVEIPPHDAVVFSLLPIAGGGKTAGAIT